MDRDAVTPWWPQQKRPPTLATARGLRELAYHARVREKDPSLQPRLSSQTHQRTNTPPFLLCSMLARSKTIAPTSTAPPVRLSRLLAVGEIDLVWALFAAFFLPCGRPRRPFPRSRCANAQRERAATAAGPQKTSGGRHAALAARDADAPCFVLGSEGGRAALRRRFPVPPRPAHGLAGVPVGQHVLPARPAPRARPQPARARVCARRTARHAHAKAHADGLPHAHEAVVASHNAYRQVCARKRRRGDRHRCIGAAGSRSSKRVGVNPWNAPLVMRLRWLLCWCSQPVNSNQERPTLPLPEPISWSGPRFKLSNPPPPCGTCWRPAHARRIICKNHALCPRSRHGLLQPRPRVNIGVLQDRARGYHRRAQASTAVNDRGNMVLGRALAPWWGAECPPSVVVVAIRAAFRAMKGRDRAEVGDRREKHFFTTLAGLS